MDQGNTLRNTVRDTLATYFDELEGETTSNLYDLVISEVELPLIEIVMRFAKGNQTRAAKWLGLSRNTLRKLLNKYKIEYQK